MSTNPQDIVDFASHLYDQTFGKFTTEVKSFIVSAAVEFSYQGFQVTLSRAYIFKLAMEHIKNKYPEKRQEEQLSEVGKMIDQVCVWGLLCGNNLPDSGKRGTKGVSLKAKKSMSALRDVFNLQRKVEKGEPHTKLNVGRFMGCFPERMLMIGKILSSLNLLQSYNFSDKTGFENLPREMQFPQMASILYEGHPLINEHKAFCVAFDKLVNTGKPNYSFSETSVLDYWGYSYRSALFSTDVRRTILQKYSALKVSDDEKEILSKVIEDKRKTALTLSKEEEIKAPGPRVPRDTEEEEEEDMEEDSGKSSLIMEKSKKLSKMIYAAASSDELSKLAEFDGNLIISPVKYFKKVPNGFKELFKTVDPSDRGSLIFHLPKDVKEGTLSFMKLDSVSALKKELNLK